VPSIKLADCGCYLGKTDSEPHEDLLIIVRVLLYLAH